MKEMAEASTVLKVDYLLTSIIAVHSGTDLLDYLKNLSRTFPENKIYITGYQTITLRYNLPENLIRLNSAEDLFQIIP